MGMLDSENANRSFTRSSTKNDDGRGSQREQVKSARDYTSNRNSNSDGRGSQREQVRSAQESQSKRESSNSDGRGSQREQRTSALASRVGSALSSIGESITGKMREVNAGTMMQSINSFSAGLAGIDPTANRVGSVKTGLTGNAGIIADTLASLGRKPHEIAGILGRLTQESSLNPEAIRKNDNKKFKGELAHSVGIAQWNGGRQQALKAFAADKGKDWKDLATQAEFLDHELKTSPDEQLARNAMARATTPAEAAMAMMHYERPQGYSAKNPTAGHGWNNTSKYASGYAENLGEFTADSVAETPTSLGARKDSASYALGESLRGLFDDSQGRLSGGGEAEPAGPSTGYDDPLVSTPAGRKARGEADYVPRNQSDVKPDRRGGFGALEVGLKEDDPLAIGKNVLGAVMNPVGYMLDSIQDGVRNSQEWNSEGPEGEPVSGIGERIANFFNSSTVDQSYRKDSGAKYGPGSGNSGANEREPKKKKKVVAEEPVASTPSSSVDFYAQMLKQLEGFTIDAPLETAERKPYDWSTL